jgi:hypothetical protein
VFQSQAKQCTDRFALEALVLNVPMYNSYLSTLAKQMGKKEKVIWAQKTSSALKLA